MSELTPRAKWWLGAATVSPLVWIGFALLQGVLQLVLADPVVTLVGGLITLVSGPVVLLLALAVWIAYLVDTTRASDSTRPSARSGSSASWWRGPSS